MRLTLDYSTIQISRKRPENSLSISLILRSQASQVSRIVHETYAFVGHPTLTCRYSNLTYFDGSFRTVCSSMFLTSLFSHAHKSEHAPC